MKLALALLFLFSCAGPVHAGIDCDDLIGTWSNKRYDETLDNERRTVASLESDGSIWIKFVYGDGKEKELVVSEEFGEWSCEGDTLIIVIDTIDQKQTYFYSRYKLLELTETHQVMVGDNLDCANSIGDCGSDIIYKYFKVLN